MLTSILKSFDTYVIVATTFSSITLSVTEIELFVVIISAAIASGFSIVFFCLRVSNAKTE